MVVQVGLAIYAYARSGRRNPTELNTVEISRYFSMAPAPWKLLSLAERREEVGQNLFIY